MPPAGAAATAPAAVRFGQAVIGPPGAGKTTYCQGMAAFLRARGRACAIINLDPANDELPYAADVDVAELVKLADVMEEHGLGPNGGLVYCMEYLEKNLDWLIGKLEAPALQGVRYLLFDFPGQVELYTHGDTVRRILTRLGKWGCRLAAVHLIDAHHCSDAGKFISAALISLTTMVRLELPHVNVLSKVDLIESGGPLAFGLGFYTDLFDLRDLLPYLDARPADPDAPDLEEEEGEGEGEGGGAGGGGAESMELVVDGGKSDDSDGSGLSVPGSGSGGAGRGGSSMLLGGGGRGRYRRLNAALCELIEDFSLVNFQTLNIQDPDAVQRVLAVADKANGYLLGAEERAAAARAQGRGGEAALLEALGAMAFRAQPDADRVKDVQDRYMGGGDGGGGR